ncbi:MAG TPA: hypothetical protein VJZ27_02095, partial [Aggregatilineales bacterium]|nr:hypothetical protein [Aggregatilineales bacterium]
MQQANSYSPGILARVILILTGIVFSLVMVEIGLRLFYPQATYGRATALTDGVFRESEWLIYELTPNFDGVLHTFENDAIDWHVKTNSLGFRDEEFTVEKPDSTYRIMITGDSFTFGMSVNDGEDYSTALEQCLMHRIHSPTHFQVINAGYASGYSPDSYYVFAQEIAPEYDPDMIISAYYVVNDFLDLYDSVWVGEVDGMPARITSRTRSLNLQGQLTFRDTLPRYKIPILRDSHVYQLLMELLLENKPDLKGAAGEYANAAEDYPYVYDPTLPPDMQDAFDRSMRMLNGLNASGAENDFAFLTLIIPSAEQTSREFWGERDDIVFPDSPEEFYPQKAIRDYLETHNIAYLDLLPDFWGKSELYFAP